MHCWGIVVSLLSLALATCVSGEYCFRNRNANGLFGQCNNPIENIATQRDCCVIGGSGWTNKPNGKRCEAACIEGESAEVESTTADPQEVVVEEVKLCFRNREPSGIRGTCSELIGQRTKEACCREGGRGWTDKRSGKRCEDTCTGVDDNGPVHYCFGSRTNRGRCVDSLGQQTKLQCCQSGGVGWSENANGRANVCQVPCEMSENPDGGCEWNEWSDWDQCSVTCEIGTKTRRRSQVSSNNDEDCSAEDEVEESACNLGPCPIHGSWGDWRLWSSCSVTCGEGAQSRGRRCNNPTPENGGDDCVGRNVMNAVCDEGPCPINGGWGIWRPAEECEATCQPKNGLGVYKERSRICDSPRPQFGGSECVGADTKRVRCVELPFCAIHGGWSDFGEWSECSQTCEIGILIRTRSCDNPPPQYDGDDCEGSPTEEQSCNNWRLCPIHGGWADWEDWSDCDAKKCGLDGSKIRSRKCTNPRPKHEGTYCTGNIIEQEHCTVCPEWGEWSDWSPCPTDCVLGSFRIRRRKCFGDGLCDGEYQEHDDCHDLDPCPDDEGFSGSGSGSGSGGFEFPCDDEDECNGHGGDAGDGLSYSVYYDGIIDEKPVMPTEDPNRFDYSVDYDFIGGNNDNGPDDEPSVPIEDKEGGDSDYSADYDNPNPNDNDIEELGANGNVENNDPSDSYSNGGVVDDIQNEEGADRNIEINAQADSYSFDDDGEVELAVEALIAEENVNAEEDSDSYSFAN